MDPRAHQRLLIKVGYNNLSMKNVLDLCYSGSLLVKNEFRDAIIPYGRTGGRWFSKYLISC